MVKNGKEKNELTPAQAKAVAAMLEHGSIEQAARAAGVGYQTLYRWVNQHAGFQAALRQAEGRLIDTAVRNLAKLQGGAIAAIAAALADKNAPHSVKLRAAEIVFSNLLKMREARTLEDRVSALEELLARGSNDEESD